MSQPPKSPISYRDAGVDIDAGAELVERIKPAAKATQRAGVIGGLGGFGGLFKLAATHYRDPILVSSTDGVGTKLKLAIDLNQHSTIGIDLVAMCVNDVLVQGAEPLFFLDYFATGALDVGVAATVINGIAQGCLEANCALLGGETAEMPDMYAPGHYDLAGFTVGAVESERLIDGSRIEVGDVIIGLASSGVHSNGYSLVRKIVSLHPEDMAQPLERLIRPCTDTHTLADALIAPTRIYVRALLKLFTRCDVRGLAHITGGGITDNLPRVLPTGTAARINLAAWTLPGVFAWLMRRGPVTAPEMLRTFNCGIGMLVVVPREHTPLCLDVLAESGEKACVVGEIIAQGGADRVVYDGALGAS